MDKSKTILEYKKSMVQIHKDQKAALNKRKNRLNREKEDILKKFLHCNSHGAEHLESELIYDLSKNQCTLILTTLMLVMISVILLLAGLITSLSPSPSDGVPESLMFTVLFAIFGPIIAYKLLKYIRRLLVSKKINTINQEIHTINQSLSAISGKIEELETEMLYLRHGQVYADESMGLGVRSLYRGVISLDKEDSDLHGDEQSKKN